MTASRRRGVPVVALGAIIAGWLAVRIMMPGADILPQGLAEPARAILTPRVTAAAAPSPPARVRKSLETIAPLVREVHLRPTSRSRLKTSALLRGEPPGLQDWTAFVPAARVPTSPADARPVPAPYPPAISLPGTAERRWSADGWLFLRPGGQSGQAGLPTYGASQAGAILRYRLAAGDPHQAVAYLRTVAALNGSRQKETAAGIAARPVPALPVVGAAELRATSDRFGSRARPVIMAYTELPAVDVGGGWSGEVYLQGGYVAGQAATGFVDGQVRLDRQLARIGKAHLRAGGGLWGGAQEGASRLDAGPTVQLVAPLSQQVFARVGLDWRFRIAGHAKPASGPALTLSAGF